MIASMTGYGKADFANENLKLTVEIKSINSKQLDVLFRMPVIFRDQENVLRNRIAPFLERGKIEININFENLRAAAPVNFNTDIIYRYKSDLDKIIEELDLPKPQEYLSLLLKMPEVMANHLPDANDEDKEILVSTTLEAVENFNKSRISEGKGLYDFFFSKIERIREFLSHTEKYESGRVSKVREKLEQQLSRLQGVEIDRGRLEQELIFYIEKLDVTEEKLRLRSHLNYFEETLGEPDEDNVAGKGKKLGFIAQEIGREINTLGSKSNDADMQKLVVMMKDELEQIKEQVLNVL